jgi:hypothetical protein
MLLHIDGSRHQWFQDERWYDLMVILDDATSEIYYAQLVEEESTATVMAGLQEVIARKGVFCALYSDRGSHFWLTPKVGGKVDYHRRTQVGRALHELGVQMIPAYSPQARGRSERSFSTWQGRLPQELRLHQIQKYKYSTTQSHTVRINGLLPRSRVRGNVRRRKLRSRDLQTVRSRVALDPRRADKPPSFELRPASLDWHSLSVFLFHRRGPERDPVWGPASRLPPGLPITLNAANWMKRQYL